MPRAQYRSKGPPRPELTRTQSLADAPTPHGSDLVFAQPHYEDQRFEEFLDYLIKQELDSSHAGSEVRYAQTRTYFASHPCSHHGRWD